MEDCVVIVDDGFYKLKKMLYRNLFKLRNIDNVISFRTDFMSPGDRNGLPDVFSFLGGCF